MKSMHVDAERRAALSYFTGHTPPPRIRPHVIIMSVLLLGITITGLILTILAYWPGYSASGIWILRIVGPVITGVGGLALMGLFLEVCFRSSKEKKLLKQNFGNLAASRSNMPMRQPSKEMIIDVPSPETIPLRSILKSSTSSLSNGVVKQDYDQVPIEDPDVTVTKRSYADITQ